MGGDEKYTQNVAGKRQGTYYSGDLDVTERIILKCI